MAGILDGELYPSTPQVNDDLKLKIRYAYFSGLENLLQTKVGKSVRSIAFDKSKFSKEAAEKWVKDSGVSLADITEDEKFVYAGVRKFSDFTETDVFERVAVGDGIEVLVKAVKPEVLQILKDKLEKASAQTAIIGGYITAPYDVAKLAADLGLATVVEETKAPSGKITVGKSENGAVNFDINFDIEKLNDEEQIVVGVVYEPDVVDAQGDSASADEIRKACHRYNIDSKTLGIMHKDAAGDRAQIIESYIAPADFRLGKGNVKRGAWVMTIKIHDPELWKQIKEGKLTGLSMAGRARAA